MGQNMETGMTKAERHEALCLMDQHELVAEIQRLDNEVEDCESIFAMIREAIEQLGEPCATTPPMFFPEAIANLCASRNRKIHSLDNQLKSLAGEDNDNLGVCGLCGRDGQALERQVAAKDAEIARLRSLLDEWTVYYTHGDTDLIERTKKAREGWEG
jgi:hypothetical protein